VRTRRHGHWTTRLAKPSVASARQAVTAPGGTLVTLTLTLTPRYRGLANRRFGVPSSVTVTFASTGHATLGQTLNVVFRKAPAHKRAKKAGVRRVGSR
jgi:hypothetical protein